MDKIDKIIKEKNTRITNIISSKDESIRLSSLRRDAAMFTASRLGTFKEVKQSDFIEEFQYWLHWLEKNVYKPLEQLEKEAIAEDHKKAVNYSKVAQKDYQSDKLNSL